MAGGYQKPSKPAPVSGPGRLARRTDGGPAQPVRELPNAQYGEAAEFRTAQQQAPLAATPPVPSPSASRMQGGTGGVVGLSAPSAAPAEPVTAGAEMGAGPGPEVLGISAMDDLRARLWAAYNAYPSEDLREILENLE
jgi:hypothetical protein